MGSIFSPAKPTLVPIPTENQVLTPTQQVQGTNNQRQSATPSFLSSAATPQGSGNQGGKTLLGQ
jgi:hypothetical protein